MSSRLVVTAIVVSLTAACRDAPSSLDSRPAPVLYAAEVLARESGWLALPNEELSVKFAVIGDSGRGSREQVEVAQRMDEARVRFPFNFVLMLGDNIYEGPASPEDYRRKFELPYRALLDAGVEFYAVLGNHDDENQRNYTHFNMRGERYYTFRPPVGPLTTVATHVRFALDVRISIDTNCSGSSASCRSPIRTGRFASCTTPCIHQDGTRQQARLTRWTLEDMLSANDVDLVFSGHEHLYLAQHAAATHPLFHLGSGGLAATRRCRPDAFRRTRLRSRLPLHADRDNGQGVALPGHHSPRAHGGRRRPSAALKRPDGQPHRGALLPRARRKIALFPCACGEKKSMTSSS